MQKKFYRCLITGFFIAISPLTQAFAIDYYAYVDTSYNYLVKKNVFTSNRFDRVFDLQPNGFTLQQVGFKVADNAEQGLGGLLYLIGGVDANRVAPSGWNPYFGSQTLAMFPAEAYLKYTVSQLVVMAGALDTLTGMETNDASQDYNFSRSILTDAQPGTATGVRAIYALNSAVSLYAGLGNGLSTFRQPLRLNMLQLGVSYAPSAKASIALQGSNGVNQVIPGTVVSPTARFTLLDLVGIYQATKILAFAVNADYFQQNKGQQPNGQQVGTTWQGIAGYIAYDVADCWRIAARAEIFDDGNGFISRVRQNWREATLTLQYQPRNNLIFRAETRRDFSNVNAFVNANGTGTADNQQSFAIEGIYLFL